MCSICAVMRKTIPAGELHDQIIMVPHGSNATHCCRCNPHRLSNSSGQCSSGLDTRMLTGLTGFGANERVFLLLSPRWASSLLLPYICGRHHCFRHILGRYRCVYHTFRRCYCFEHICGSDNGIIIIGKFNPNKSSTSRALVRITKLRTTFLFRGVCPIGFMFFFV